MRYLIALRAVAAAASLATASPVLAEDIRIFGGIMSALPIVGGGMREIDKQLKADGYNSHQMAYFTPFDGSYLAYVHTNDICKRKSDGTLSDPLILGGHSYGGVIIAKIINGIARCGVMVRYAFFVDSPITYPIGSNVGRIDNFLAAISFIGSRPVLKDGVEAPVFEHTYPITHIAIGYLPEVQEEIFTQIKEAVGRGR